MSGPSPPTNTAPRLDDEDLKTVIKHDSSKKHHLRHTSTTTSTNINVGDNVDLDTTTSTGNHANSLKKNEESGNENGNGSRVESSSAERAAGTDEKRDSSSSIDAKADIWTRLKHLQTLNESGVISETEYERRKQQLVDELTGTKLKNDSPSKTKNNNDIGSNENINTGAQNTSSNNNNIPKRERTKRRDKTREKSLSKSSNGSERKDRSHDHAREGESTGGSASSGIPPVMDPTEAFLPRSPPNWAHLPAETAIVHSYDLHSKKWTHLPILVKIDTGPFARGSLRLAYHMTILPGEPGSALPPALIPLLEPHGEDQSYVAKISIDPFEDRQSYYIDVIMQQYAKAYAEQYNLYNPPKKVEFVFSSLLELLDRPHRVLCAVERFLPGVYRKHNNNFGYVSENERYTPQAFSHFTYECSGHRLLICDIQGVNDCYTDPQIHSHDSQGFGKGNLGQRGLDKFLSTHRCNAICKYLKLPSINPKLAVNDESTMPSTMVMKYHAVEVISVQGWDDMAESSPAPPGLGMGPTGTVIRGGTAFAVLPPLIRTMHQNDSLPTRDVIGNNGLPQAPTPRINSNMPLQKDGRRLDMKTPLLKNHNNSDSTANPSGKANGRATTSEGATDHDEGDPCCCGWCCIL